MSGADAHAIPDPNFRAPDLIEAVEGWRVWRVAVELPRYGTAPKLYSVSRPYFWAPQRESVAKCARLASPCEAIPGEQCSCGFYSARTLAHLLRLGYHPYDPHRGEVTVVGQVANWGKVIEAEQGWRAAKSYPVRLFVPYEMWRLAIPLGEAYGVPVQLRNILQRSYAGYL